MEIGEKYLPIGTVVYVGNTSKKVMITGYCASAGNDEKKIWDYTGCMYPQGMISLMKVLFFDHSQIREICYKGLENEEYMEFQNELKKYESENNIRSNNQ